MKKNMGAQLALYPSPVILVGAMVDGKPNWTLVAHAGVMAHSHLMKRFLLYFAFVMPFSFLTGIAVNILI